MPQDWFAQFAPPSTKPVTTGPSPYDPSKRLNAGPVGTEDFIDRDNNGVADKDEDPGWIGNLKTLAKHFYQSSPAAMAKLAYDLRPTPDNLDYYKNAVGLRDSLVNASADQWAAAAKAKGWDKVSHTAAALIPGLGPAVRSMGEEAGAASTGDTRAGFGLAGDIAGLASGAALAEGGPIARGVKATSKAGLRALSDSPAGPVLADTLDRMANRKLVRQTVQTGANSTAVARGSAMNEIAPDLLRDQVSYKDPASGHIKTIPLPNMGAASRTGLGAKISDALDTGLSEMNDAYAKIGDNIHPTKPLVDAIKTKLSDLNVKGVKTVDAATVADMDPADVEAFKKNGGRVNPDGSITGQSEAEISTQKIRASVIKSGLAELGQLGQSMDVANLHKLAQRWNEGAKAIYTPDSVQGAAEARAAGMGYADLERTTRDFIAKKYPEIAPVNAKYHMLREADNIVRGAENIDRVKSNRTLATGALGGAVGEIAGHMAGQAPMLGASVGVVIAPIIDAALTKGVTTQIGVARLMAKAADAIRDGKTAPAQAAILNAASASGAKVAPSMITKAFTDQRGMADFTGKKGITPAASLPGNEFASTDTPTAAADRPVYRDPNDAAYDAARASTGMGKTPGIYQSAIDRAKANPDIAASAVRGAQVLRDNRIDAKIDSALDGILAEDMSTNEQRAAHTALQSSFTTIAQRAALLKRGPGAKVPMPQVDNYVRILDALNASGRKLSTQDVADLTKGVDGAANIGRKSSYGAKGRESAQTSNSFEGFVRDATTFMRPMNHFTSGSLYEFMRSDKFRNALSGRDKTPAVTPIDPDTVVGRHAILPDGREVWKQEDGRIVLKDKRGYVYDPNDDEMATILKSVPHLKGAS